MSMGNAAGLKAWQVLANTEWALAIELLAGAQGVEFLAPLEPGPASRPRASSSARCRRACSRTGPLVGRRSSWSPSAIRDGSLLAAVEDAVGALR